MTHWFQGKRGGVLGFVVIAILVAGGLAWVTAAALRLEQEQSDARAEAEVYGKLRLALWRLDSRVFPVLAKEVSRPFHQYSAISPPTLALGPDGKPLTPGAVLEPSPLLSENLPDWILLHFQTTAETSSAGPQVFSPQVLSASLRQRLERPETKLSLTNVTPEREQRLAQLRRSLAPPVLLAWIDKQEEKNAGPQGPILALENTAIMPAINNDAQVANQAPNQPAPQMAQNAMEYSRRFGQQQLTQNAQREWAYQDEVDLTNNRLNGEQWLTPVNPRKPRSRFVSVSCSVMVPYWLKVADEDQLVVARRVQVDEQQLCQGMLLDWKRLATQLTAELRDLFPDARLSPTKDESSIRPERNMTSLPLQLDPGPNPIAAASIGWSPLRFGLALSWLAALVALVAVGLGGWSLWDLSERRMRFVSAVTHELRTPLTTLRLYLDMLNAGMVQDEARKGEYMQTLHAEAERLHRLVANVLDFARLENQRTRPEKTDIPVGDFLTQLRGAWEDRCREAGKDLIIEDHLPGGAVLCTDTGLVQQIVGNLIENACKYSRSAKDARLWVRAQPSDGKKLLVEVEDRGPGVPASERRAVFRPFHRGRTADVTAAGVGLGLALAERWAKLLGGKLTLGVCKDQVGACFRLEVPTLKENSAAHTT
jgi:signal transduction histidine kinase